MIDIKGKDKVFFGRRKSDGATIYLTKPSWDCGWYWSFGYLGNAREHYHLDGYQTVDHYLKLADGSHKFITEKRNKCMRDCLLEDYDLNPKIEANLWKFCELALCAYQLKKAAELFHRGGAHMTSPIKELRIKSEFKFNHITKHLLPRTFNAISDLIEGD